MARRFLQTFSDAFQALLSVDFNFVLKSCSLNSCVIFRQMKIPFFVLASFSLGNFALNRQTLRFLYPSLSQIFLSNRARYVVEANRCITYSLKPDVPHSSDLVLFPNEVANFLFCNGSPSLGCPIHTKSSRI
jgi:hypothetical protein